MEEVYLRIYITGHGDVVCIMQCCGGILGLSCAGFSQERLGLYQRWGKERNTVQVYTVHTSHQSLDLILPVQVLIAVGSLYDGVHLFKTQTYF